MPTDRHSQTVALQELYDHLPLYSEEGGEFTKVDLTSFYNSKFKGQTDSVSTITLVQRLFTALCLLDRVDLQNGHWRFVSFPASLAARSILQALIREDSTLLSPDFWISQDSLSPASEQQRRVLHDLETARVKHSVSPAAPIRYVHVAWGLVIVDGKVLLRHREDRNRHGSNNFVLIGGRLSQNDLRRAGISEPLKVLQCPSASESQPAIKFALAREIAEETGLEEGRHYVAKPWRIIKPYGAVEGAGANHAYTEYRIHVFTVNLSLSGLLALHQNVACDPNLTWFTLNELAQAKSSDGRMAYIDALIADFSTQKEWEEQALALQESYRVPPSMDSNNTTVTLPIYEGETLLSGRTGKEKPLDIPLTTEQKQILMALHLIASGNMPTTTTVSVEVIGSGWVAITDDELLSSVQELATLLGRAGVPLIESHQQHYFRLALSPSNSFLSESIFNLSISDDSLKILRQAIQTPLGFFPQEVKTFKVSERTVRDIKSLANPGRSRLMSDEDLQKVVRRYTADEANKMGLRTLIRCVGNELELAIGLSEIAE